MFKRFVITVLLALTLLALAAPAAAQGGEKVTITNETDSLELVGVYYAPPESDTPAPAVLLMHHGGSRKEAWVDLVPLLTEAGYATLAIDIRGHGETGGSLDLDLAQEDAHLWIAWLRAQPGVDPDRVSLVGASLGADVGMQVMAQDPTLNTIVGISIQIQVESMNALTALEAFDERPLYVIAASGVDIEAEAARALFAAAPGEVSARLYNNTSCCTFLLMFDSDLGPSIVRWLDRHN